MLRSYGSPLAETRCKICK